MKNSIGKIRTKQKNRPDDQTGEWHSNECCSPVFFYFCRMQKYLALTKVGANPDRLAVSSGGLGATLQQAFCAFRYRKALLANSKKLKYMQNIGGDKRKSLV